MKLTGHAEPVSAQASQFPLSMNQQFVCLFDHGDEDGPFGPRYHMAAGWRIRGRLDDDALRRALYDLVARHEAVRTLVMDDGGGKYQVVYPPAAPDLMIRELQGEGAAAPGEQADRLVRQIEGETISPERVPLLRAVLSRFDDRDAVLVLLVHHLATDGWSMRVIVRDLASLYAAQRGHDVPPLPDVPQYRAYSQWQCSGAAAKAAAREYWHRHLDGARLTAIPTTTARSAGLPQSTAAHRFKTFTEVLERTRRSCLEGYSNDIPAIDIFAEAPELMQPAMNDRTAPVVFQIFPDPVVLGNDVPGEFQRVLRTAAAAPDSPPRLA